MPTPSPRFQSMYNRMSEVAAEVEVDVELKLDVARAFLYGPLSKSKAMPKQDQSQRLAS